MGPAGRRPVGHHHVAIHARSQLPELVAEAQVVADERRYPEALHVEDDAPFGTGRVVVVLPGVAEGVQLVVAGQGRPDRPAGTGSRPGPRGRRGRCRRATWRPTRPATPPRRPPGAEGSRWSDRIPVRPPGPGPWRTRWETSPSAPPAGPRQRPPSRSAAPGGTGSRPGPPRRRRAGRRRLSSGHRLSGPRPGP